MTDYDKLSVLRDTIAKAVKNVRSSRPLAPELRYLEEELAIIDRNMDLLVKARTAS